jgi:hypothetical protein
MHGQVSSGLGLWIPGLAVFGRSPGMTRGEIANAAPPGGVEKISGAAPSFGFALSRGPCSSLSREGLFSIAMYDPQESFAQNRTRKSIRSFCLARFASCCLSGFHLKT